MIILLALIDRKNTNIILDILVLDGMEEIFVILRTNIRLYCFNNNRKKKGAFAEYE